MRAWARVERAPDETMPSLGKGNDPYRTPGKK